MNEVAHLPTFFWSKVPARQVQDQRVFPLYVREPPLAARLIWQLVIGQAGTRLNISSHTE